MLKGYVMHCVLQGASKVNMSPLKPEAPAAGLPRQVGPLGLCVLASSL